MKAAASGSEASHRVSARVVSEVSPRISGWLPGAPPGKCTSGLSAMSSGSRKMLTGLLITAGLPPERYDAVTSFATSRALSLRSVTGLPSASSIWNATTRPVTETGA